MKRMAAARTNLETEIKLRLAGARDGRARLKEAGFQVRRRRTFEANVIYDTPAQDLRGQGMLLRLRRYGPHSVLTYKGPSRRGRHRTRPEFEVIVSDPVAAAQILCGLGFGPCFRYEKYRTEFSNHEPGGIALLDQTPIGDFLELEGEPEWIDRAARRLGFSSRDYVTESYGALYLAWCRDRNQPPGDMVFARISQAP
jgi:adenylate cyclase class 2